MEKHVDKAPVLVESMSDNGGKQSVFRVTLQDGASTPPHFHSDFDETFAVIEGEVRIQNGKEHMTLSAGMSATAKRTVVHAYNVPKEAIAVVEITLTPGHEGFEHVIHIMNGLQKDGKYDQTSTFSWSNIPLLATITALSDTHLVGVPKMMMKLLTATHGAKKLARVQQELLDAYCKA